MSISASDLLLSADLTEDEARQFLKTFGFRHAAAADRHLQALADDVSVREALAALADLLLEAVRDTPDPDAALAAFVHYASTRSPRAGFLHYLREDPRALHVLIQISGRSAFLAELLVCAPESFHWLVREVDRSPPDVIELTSEAQRRLGSAVSVRARREALRSFADLETLRIGARHLLGRETAGDTRAQLADVVEVVIGQALTIAREMAGGPADPDDVGGRFVVMAGDRSVDGGSAATTAGSTATGASEIEYAADAELIFVYDCEDGPRAVAERYFETLARMLTDVLAEPSNGRPLQRVRHPAWFVHEGSAPIRPLRTLRSDLDAGDLDAGARAFLRASQPIAGDLTLGQELRLLTEPPA